MKLTRYWWFFRFMQYGFILSFAFMVTVGIGGGLWYPISSWLFADIWQWMPFDRWLHYILLCIPSGLWAAFGLTAYEWWQNRK